MEWVLFVLVIGQGSTGAVALTTAVFHTEAGCRSAAYSAEFVFDPHVQLVKTFCAPNNPLPG